MNFQMKRTKITAFSPISLTDIVLLLLIFFLLSSSFFVQPGIKVTLPKAITGQVETKDRVYLTITKKQAIYLNNQMIFRSELVEKLSALLKGQPERMVVIQADKDVTLEQAVEIIDLAKMAGAQKFLIATQPGAKP